MSTLFRLVPYIYVFIDWYLHFPWEQLPVFKHRGRVTGGIIHHQKTVEESVSEPLNHKEDLSISLLWHNNKTSYKHKYITNIHINYHPYLLPEKNEISKHQWCQKYSVNMLFGHYRDASNITSQTYCRPPTSCPYLSSKTLSLLLCLCLSLTHNYVTSPILVLSLACAVLIVLQSPIGCDFHF